MSSVRFVSSNEHKFGEARRILERMGVAISTTGPACRRCSPTRWRR